jgi:hypothetical protein
VKRDSRRFGKLGILFGVLEAQWTNNQQLRDRRSLSNRAASGLDALLLVILDEEAHALRPRREPVWQLCCVLLEAGEEGLELLRTRTADLLGDLGGRISGCCGGGRRHADRARDETRSVGRTEEAADEGLGGGPGRTHAESLLPIGSLQRVW